MVFPCTYVPVCRIMSLKELVSAANQSVDQSKLVLWPSTMYIHVLYMIFKMTKANQFNSPEEMFFQRSIGCLRWDSKPRLSALDRVLCH